MKLTTVDEILNFAIEKEQDAADFYNGLAAKMDRQAMKDVFAGFAREEMGHKAKLQAVKAGRLLISAEKKVADLKIGDHLSDIELTPNVGYQEALILAMKAEKAAFKLYSDLASATDNADLREVLLSLAHEEAKHKLRFEVEYDDVILTEN
ncbi:ferritin family protein [bacterium]|nr:ferritin family protein [bacterium]